MMLFSVVGIFILLMAATVAVCVVLALGVILFGSGRRGGRSRVPAPGEMDAMTDSIHPRGMAGHAQPGISEADRLIATGIAVDTLAAAQSHGHGHAHGGHHDAGMHHSQDVSPPMHHDPGPHDDAVARR